MPTDSYSDHSDISWTWLTQAKTQPLFQAALSLSGWCLLSSFAQWRTEAEKNRWPAQELCLHQFFYHPRHWSIRVSFTSMLTRPWDRNSICHTQKVYLRAWKWNRDYLDPGSVLPPHPEAPSSQQISCNVKKHWPWIVKYWIWGIFY